MKYTEEVTGETFVKKVEARLFTQKVMHWSEIKRRAATNPAWQWHRPDALDKLKADCLHQEVWRENGGYVEKGPFPKPATQVKLQELSRDDDTGRVKLRATPINGDTIYVEIGAPATTASHKLSGRDYETDELAVSFLAVDSTGEHETGEPLTWNNRITIKSRVYDNGGDKMVELRTAPPAPIRYSTDGSDPKVAGGAYDDPFVVPQGTRFVLAVAEDKGITSETHQVPINWDRSSRRQAHRQDETGHLEAAQSPGEGLPLQHHPLRLRLHRAAQEAPGQGGRPAHRGPRRPLGGPAARRRPDAGQRADPRHRGAPALPGQRGRGDHRGLGPVVPHRPAAPGLCPRDRRGAAAQRGRALTVAAPKKPACQGFGFCPEESTHHFLVTIPASNREDVLISEHFTWDESTAATPPTFALGEAEGKLRVLLARAKWDAIADEVRVEFNRRLKQDGPQVRELEDRHQPRLPPARQGAGAARLGHRGGGPGPDPDRHQELAGAGPRGALVALHHDLRRHRPRPPGPQQGLAQGGALRAHGEPGDGCAP